jgi:hypothetical protein
MFSLVFLDKIMQCAQPFAPCVKVLNPPCMEQKMELMESVALGLLDIVLANTQNEESEQLSKEEIFALYDECVAAVKKHKPAPRAHRGDSDDRPKRAYSPRKFDDERGGDRGGRSNDWDERPRSKGGVYAMRDNDDAPRGRGPAKREGGFKKKRFAD